MNLLSVVTDKTEYLDGETITWTAEWKTIGDNVKLYIDNDPTFYECGLGTTGGCMANSADWKTTSPFTVQTFAWTGMPTTWYAKLCNDEGKCDIGMTISDT